MGRWSFRCLGVQVFRRFKCSIVLLFYCSIVAHLKIKDPISPLTISHLTKGPIASKIKLKLSLKKTHHKEHLLKKCVTFATLHFSIVVTVIQNIV